MSFFQVFRLSVQISHKNVLFWYVFRIDVLWFFFLDWKDEKLYSFASDTFCSFDEHFYLRFLKRDGLVFFEKLCWTFFFVDWMFCVMLCDSLPMWMKNSSFFLDFHVLQYGRKRTMLVSLIRVFFFVFQMMSQKMFNLVVWRIFVLEAFFKMRVCVCSVDRRFFAVDLLARVCWFLFGEGEEMMIWLGSIQVLTQRMTEKLQTNELLNTEFFFSLLSPFFSLLFWLRDYYGTPLFFSVRCWWMSKLKISVKLLSGFSMEPWSFRRRERVRNAPDNSVGCWFLFVCGSFEYFCLWVQFCDCQFNE